MAAGAPRPPARLAPDRRDAAARAHHRDPAVPRRDRRARALARSRVDTWSGPDGSVTSGQRLEDCPLVGTVRDDIFPSWIRFDGKVYRLTDTIRPMGFEPDPDFPATGYTLGSMALFRVVNTPEGQSGHDRAGQARHLGGRSRVPGHARLQLTRASRDSRPAGMDRRAARRRRRRVRQRPEPAAVGRAVGGRRPPPRRPSPSAPPEQTLTVAIAGDLSGGLSNAATGADTPRIASFLFDGLYGLDEHLAPVPKLAAGLATVSLERPRLDDPAAERRHVP